MSNVNRRAGIVLYFSLFFFFCFLFILFCFFLIFSFSWTLTFHQCICFISLLIFVSFCLIICVILYVLLHSTNGYVETNVNFAVRCFKLLGRFLYVSFFCYIYNNDNDNTFFMWFHQRFFLFFPLRLFPPCFLHIWLYPLFLSFFFLSIF